MLVRLITPRKIAHSVFPKVPISIRNMETFSASLVNPYKNSQFDTDQAHNCPCDFQQVRYSGDAFENKLNEENAK